ncbi:SpoIIE family protein phosphatase [Streptacidiphilus sp. PB12-B1b]|uniref:SpoIIE family protein phosphatase n=1 Tax=Streptacidiphilus sp. PB12-B1b TaxID=2705012 RepID=UPI0015FC2750|nr:SpoIIE family protein phosphatase [Streptacidiphilus sp. PB12-B1b]QMU77222.1 SpoIIE family protein phosphatase [Streptacidiphilus sp. PB12-B1b]
MTKPTTSGSRARLLPPGLLAADQGSELNALMERTPWSQTVLGPVQDWSAELRTAVGVCLNSPFPMLVMWGPELAMVYNDAFVPILGAKHPALGQPCAQVWSDAWPVVGGMLSNVLEHGESTYHQDLPLVLQRHGFDETVYFTFAYSAIPLADGGVGGVFTVVTETTTQVLGTRRLGTLRELGQARSAQTSEVEQACAATTDVLSSHREDAPFGVVYLLDDDGATARAVSWFGLSEPLTAQMPHLPPAVSAPTEADADADTEAGWIWQALAANRPQTRSGMGSTLREHVLPVPEAAGPATVDTAVALPLSATGSDRPHGVVVLGTNAHLALDDAYQEYLNLAANHLTAAISDARARAAQLRRAEELAELNLAKTKFFTSVSHELRTPLTLIAGPAGDALADERHPLADAQRRRLEIIHRNAGRLRRQVDTLLDFSRIEDGRLHSEPVAVDLGALTRGIAQSFAPAVERAQLGFTVDCPTDSPALLIDPGMWERIVLNLLSNAVKFTLRGEIRLSLLITADTVELTVADTGIGIAPHELPHIFARFRQVRGAGGRSHEGSGIGLALVQELAALHGGVALADSRPGHGTTLTLRLPARTAQQAPQVELGHGVVQDYLAEALQWSAPVSDADDADLRKAPAPPRAGTVLVAEDNADLRNYLQALLTPEYSVTSATDGHQALRLARERRPDLILADVMMPGLDGFALLRALRADPATARTPVVFLSARAGQEAAAEGLAAGADDYLAKPFSSADLLARVRSNLDLARLRNHESAWRTALVNAMQDGFFVADQTLAIIEINDGFTRLLGYEAPQLPWPVPHPWWPTPDQDPDGYALVDAALDVVRAQGRGRFVLPLRHRDGRRLWVDVALDSLRDHTGTGQLVVGTLRDVTAAHLTAERDAAISRLADLLTGIDDSATVLSVGLAELRDCWQAERATVLRWHETPQHTPVAVSAVACTGPTIPTGTDLPPSSAMDDARQGRMFTDANTTGHGPSDTDTFVSTVGAPLFDGGDQAMLWLEFATPRPFSVADRTLLVQLTGHLQRALSRARASDEQRQVALALQRAILGPADLPPGFAVRYEPASSSLEVGGDWYDVLELPGHRYGIVVGDVVGRGLPAATTMGQLRSAARALLLENSGPAHVLDAMDRFAALLPDAYCTTAFCAVIDPTAQTLRYSSAGHLPALLRHPDSTVRRLDDAQSVPLGVVTNRRRPETTTTLPTGSHLLLYTDGLVERRHEIIDTGIHRAEAALAATPSSIPDAVVDHLCTLLLDRGRHEDDVALLLYHQT